MSKRLFFQFLFIIFSILLLASCKTSQTNNSKAKRYYYNFAQKKLLASQSDTKEVFRAVPYQASKSIQIEIFDYNPLRDEISIEDSSLERFLNDTEKLAKFVVLPKVEDLKDAAQALTVNVADSTVFLINKNKPVKTACDSLRMEMSDFNDTKEEIENAVDKYQILLTKIEVINDDYEYLKGLITLKPADIKDRLTISFLNRLNEFVGVEKALNNDPSLTSSGDILNLEDRYFKDVTKLEDELDAIKEDVDELQGNCKEFLNLYKKFNSSFTRLKDALREFKNSHAKEILAGLNKTILAYDKLKVYMTEIPNIVTRAVPITKDLHTITIYTKEIGKEGRIKYDYIDIEPTRGFKIDIAGGVFYSGLYDENFTKKSKDSIYTKQYLVNGVTRDTTVQESFAAVYKKDQFKGSFGGMLFIHAHSQNACWLNYGVYLGFGALFNDQTRWAGSFGGSLLLGKSQRFSINPGIVLGQVERLSPPYKMDTWYRESLDNVPTYKAWKTNFILGFSWNIK